MKGSAFILLLLLGQRDTEVNCLKGTEGDPEGWFYVPAENKNTNCGIFVQIKHILVNKTNMKE